MIKQLHLFLFFVGYSFSSFAQQFNLQFEELVNDGVNYEVAVQMSGTSLFDLGSSNLVFTYDPLIMNNPSLNLNGFGSDFFVTLTEPKSGTISLNIILTSSGSGKSVADASFTNLASISFDVLSLGASPSLEWQYSGQQDKSVVFLDDDATQIFSNTLSDLAGNALPLELADFQVTWSSELQNFSTVQWTTLSEQNLKLFEIERSFNAVDWERIGSTEPLNTTHTTNYEFVDENVGFQMPGEEAFYRIKVIELDGSVDYSSTILLERIGTKGSGYTKIWPVPFKESLHIEYAFQDKRAQPVVLTLTHISGKVIRELEVVGSRGFVKLDNLENEANGVYILTLRKSTESIEKKIIKQ